MYKHLILVSFLLLSIGVNAQKQGNRYKRKRQANQKKIMKYKGPKLNTSSLKMNAFDVLGGLGEKSYIIGLGYTRDMENKLVKVQVSYEKGKYFEVEYKGVYFSLMGGYRLKNKSEKFQLSALMGVIAVNDSFSFNSNREISEKLERYNGINYGITGMIDVSYKVSNVISFFGMFQQMNVATMPKNQRGRWNTGLGIRFVP